MSAASASTSLCRTVLPSTPATVSTQLFIRITLNKDNRLYCSSYDEGKNDVLYGIKDKKL